jgi:hypothetical protein
MRDARLPRDPGPRPTAGYSFEGEGFYVWDEDAREARLSGEGLLRVVSGRRAAREGCGWPPDPGPERTP